MLLEPTAQLLVTRVHRGIREFVSAGIFLSFQAQLLVSLNLTSLLMITFPLIGLNNLYGLDLGA